MRLHTLVADPQLVCDARVGVPPGHEAEHLCLAGAERLPRSNAIVRRACHSIHAANLGLARCQIYPPMPPTTMRRTTQQQAALAVVITPVDPLKPQRLGPPGRDMTPLLRGPTASATGQMRRARRTPQMPCCSVPVSAASFSQASRASLPGAPVSPRIGRHPRSQHARSYSGSMKPTSGSMSL